jgi:hypothetical protein
MQKLHPWAWRPSNLVLQLARFAAVAAGCAIVAANAPARAEEVSDVQGDFQALFLQAHPGRNGADLDVKSAAAFFDGTSFHLTATMYGDIGTTAGGLYVWGVNRGEGVDFFETLPNPTGDGVSFDSFIVMNQDGTGMLVRDFLPGGLDTFAKPLDAGQITIDGATINLTVALADLPSRGLDPLQFGFNIWPRVDGTSSNDLIADFAPNARNITAAYVPEPAAWALMIAGFGGVGSVLRRRRRLAFA